MSLARLVTRLLKLPMDRLITSHRTWLVECITINRCSSVLRHGVGREAI